MTCVRVGAGRRRGFVCVDDEQLTVPNPDCPNAAQHTPHPVGYGAHSAWAWDMLDAHDQVECPGCGTLAIWTPNAATDAAA